MTLAAAQPLAPARVRSLIARLWARRESRTRGAAGRAVWGDTLERRVLLSTVNVAAARVAEASGYQVVYDLNVPLLGGSYNANPVPYTADHAATTGPFDRVAYYVELTPKSGGTAKWVYVSAAAFTNEATKLGVPTLASGAFFQQTLGAMNVQSNVAGVVKGNNLPGGTIEFWPSSYTAANDAAVAGASAAKFDFGDGGAGLRTGFGSMQVHNTAAKQTLFAYNDWGGVNPSKNAEIGIGNNPSGNPDWTHADTANQYAARLIQVLVRPVTVPAAPAVAEGTIQVLPLGDSITTGTQRNQPPDGYVPGGYRNKLYSELTAAGVKLKFLGSSTHNPTAALTAAGQTHHEGHGGYQVDQVFRNLLAADGSALNNGGFWLSGTATRAALTPDYVLLHAGTNDINHGASFTTVSGRLDTLVRQITTARPDARLIVAGIVPNPTAAKNSVVKAYNAYVRDTLVPKYAKLGFHVSFVDQYRHFVDASGKVIAARFPDGLHPDKSGYELMGQAWAAAIKADLAGNGPPTPTPAPTPTPIPTPTPTPTPPPVPVSANGLTATYFDNADFTGARVQRLDASVNFNWQKAAPATGIGADTFSVRWTGKVTPPTTGDYAFAAAVNDGVRLWVNGQQVINQWSAAGPVKRVAPAIRLTAGVAYDIKLEYFENLYDASCRLLWTGPGIAEQAIPSARLTPVSSPAPTPTPTPAPSPEPTPTPTAVPVLTGLTLMNAAGADAVIGPLGDHPTIDLAILGSELNVRAEPGAHVGSVVFRLDGLVVRTETSRPLAFAGDSDGDLLPWTPPPGTHTISATPFAGKDGTGIEGPPLTFTFEVV